MFLRPLIDHPATKPVSSYQRVWRCFFALIALFGFSAVQAQPNFSKSFSPSTIGSGSVSTLTFTITNNALVPATDLAFTDTLPVAVTLADPANASSDCIGLRGGSLTAPDGGGTITLTGGVVGGNSTCTVTVDVISSTAGTHMNASGSLTSSLGNSGTASADLTVATDRPGFSKSFSPSTISYGGRSTLTFTIDNTTGSDLSSLSFTDILPAGMLIAEPANVATTCTGDPDPNLTAIAGTDVISFSSFSSFGIVLLAGETCTISVDVTADCVDIFDNVTGELSSNAGSSGKASDTLTVTGDTVILSKSFTDDPVNPGDPVTLEFTLINTNRNNSASNLSFTDNLDATLAGLVATGLPANNVCGVGSQLSGTGLLNFTGGNLAAGASCTFSVTLQVPAGAAGGAYPNTTGTITATDTLFINNGPVLSKTFLNSPVSGGDTSTLEFTITNNSLNPVSDISFEDNLGAFLSGVTVTALPANGFCGAGASLATFSSLGSLFLGMSNGSLAAGDSCTFSVDLLIPVGAANGTFVNTTEAIFYTESGTTQNGQSASATLEVLPVPTISKSFIDDPVLPGETVTLEFTVSTPGADPSQDAIGVAVTDLAFTDDLNAVLVGLTATGLPQNDICGSGSEISGTTNLSFTGGSLSAGETCSFNVALQTPTNAPPGNGTNITSNVTATVAGETATGNSAQDDLQIIGLNLTKSFTDDPVIPGGIVNLEFTLDNTASTQDATGIFFTDNLGNALSGLVAVAPLPTDPCGAGSAIIGTKFLIFTGGNLTAGTSCTFSLTLQVPGSAADNIYSNLTSDVIASIGGSPVTLDPAIDQLIVNSNVLVFSKAFDGSSSAGGTASLTFTIENPNATTVSGISFSDDLDAVIPGLVATNLPMNDVCGTGSVLSGTSLLTLTDGSLSANGSCSFSITVQVPATATAGTFANTTSDLSSGDNLFAANPATANLVIEPPPTFAKNFAPDLISENQTSTLTFTIDNTASALAASNLDFTDNLPAGIVIATPQNSATTCTGGTITATAGSGTISYSGGTVAAGASCTVQADVTANTAGSFMNVSGDLTSSSGNSGTATDTLTVNPPPVFTARFAPNQIIPGQFTTFTFTIDNTASSIAATGLMFTGDLPAGLVIGDPINRTIAVTKASTTCIGGTLTAVTDTTTISYSGGTVNPGETCIVQVDVTGDIPGQYTITVDVLDSSLGQSGPASAALLILNPGQEPAGIPTLQMWGLLLMISLLGWLIARRTREIH